METKDQREPVKPEKQSPGNQYGSLKNQSKLSPLDPNEGWSVLPNWPIAFRRQQTFAIPGEPFQDAADRRDKWLPDSVRSKRVTENITLMRSVTQARPSVKRN